MKKKILILLAILILTLTGCGSTVNLYEGDDFYISKLDGWFFEDNIDNLPENTLLVIVNRNLDSKNYSSINVSFDSYIDSEMNKDDFYTESIALVENVVGYKYKDIENFSFFDSKGKKHLFSITNNEEEKFFMQYYLYDENTQKGFVITATTLDSTDSSILNEIDSIVSTFQIKSNEQEN